MKSSDQAKLHPHPAADGEALVGAGATVADGDAVVGAGDGAALVTEGDAVAVAFGDLGACDFNRPSVAGTPKRLLAPCSDPTDATPDGAASGARPVAAQLHVVAPATTAMIIRTMPDRRDRLRRRR